MRILAISAAVVLAAALPVGAADTCALRKAFGHVPEAVLACPQPELAQFIDMSVLRGLAGADLRRRSVSGAAVGHDRTWQAAAIDKAVEQHVDNLPKGCDVPDDPIAPLAIHDLPIGEDTAAREALLLKLPCKGEISVYLLSDDEGTVSEIRLLTPFVANMGEVDPDSGPARDQVRIDWHETRQVSQPDYDEDRRVLSSRVQWPGEDGSYSAALWGFRDGRFQLMQFAVDANRNGQDDPEILFKSQLW